MHSVTVRTNEVATLQTLHYTAVPLHTFYQNNVPTRYMYLELSLEQSHRRYSLPLCLRQSTG